MQIGGTGRALWTSGFHSGDDDPMGLDIAPNHHAGPHLLAREGLMADEGVGGPREIWRFDAALPQGERVLLWLRILYCVVPGVLMLLAALLSVPYSIDRRLHARIEASIRPARSRP